MAARDISIVGLPGAGKTTLLAALWHVVQEDEGAATLLRFGRLAEGNYEHLNAIRRQWRSGRIQKRTALAGGMRTVVMELVDADGTPARVTFPDAPGEDYRRMWEERSVDDALGGSLEASMIVLVVNGDRIELPHWVAHRAEVLRQAGQAEEAAEASSTSTEALAGVPSTGSEASAGETDASQGLSDVVDWDPLHAPTQVQLVDLLQQLMRPPLGRGARRLALLISSWDQVEDEGLSPAELVRTKLPLLDQYLGAGRDPWDWRVWGISAQGGDYDDPEAGEKGEDADRLRAFDRASDRIQVVSSEGRSKDLTEPLAWLLN